MKTEKKRKLKMPEPINAKKPLLNKETKQRLNLSNYITKNKEEAQNG